jgi:hypothetical protein
MIRRSTASSSGVHAANDLSRHTSMSEAIRPSMASSSSWPAPPGSVAGTWMTAAVSVAARHIAWSGSARASGSSRKNRRKTRSYTGSWSRRVTNVVRPAQ